MAADRVPGRAARAAAALWLARLHREPPAAGDADAFRAWLAEHAEHRRAFDDATRVWDAAGGLRDLGLDRRGAPAPVLTRRRLFEAAAAMAVLGTGFGAWRSAMAGVYETGLGEQRRVTLEDGSDLLLDTDTRIRVRIDAETRRVDLARGRVNCRVADDPVRPFVVDAGLQQIVASGSVMDVRRDAEQVSVICLQGSADVAAPAMPARRLAVGQRLNASASRPATIDQPELAPLVAWQNGQAIFDNVTLAEAIREMNRYGRTHLELTDPHLAGLRISGTYHVGNPVAFAQSAAALLPVRVERSGDSIRLVLDPDRYFLAKG